MEHMERGEPRDHPSAAEAEFIERIEALMPRSLDFYFWQDRDGTPWMIAFLSFSTGAYIYSMTSNYSEGPEIRRRLVKTLRLDFDSGGIRGGWSTDNMDWDANIRAEAAGVDMSSPDGISIMASDSTPDEIARAAAAWFQRHWEDWIRERERSSPAGRSVWRNLRRSRN